MTRRDFLRVSAGGLGAWTLGAICPDLVSAAGSAPKSSRNVVLILADDLGWRDLGCTGSDFYETPNLDRLARRSVRFAQAYSAGPCCSPTRASILTGRYPARVGITTTTGHAPIQGNLLEPAFADHLAGEETTLAEVLGGAGWQTWHVGKWHLGGRGFLPTDQGFAVNIGGSEAGAVKSHFAPWGIENAPAARAGAQLGDVLTDEAIRLIRQRDRSKPFLLNYWPYDPHGPIQAKPELVAKYTAKAKRLGLTKMPATITGEPAHGQGTQAKKIIRRQFQSNPVYAGMVETLDTNVGRLLDALDAEGLTKDTLIIFSSDNGGIGVHYTSPSTCNLPLKEGKGWLEEGGIRVPLMIAWPGVTDAGSTCAVPVISNDFFPTILETAGLPPQPKAHCDGVSLVPLVTAGDALPARDLFWHDPHYGGYGSAPASAIRSGDWKLIDLVGTGRAELYNVASDPGEARDLAAQEPDRVADLKARLEAWRNEVKAKLPVRNPNSRSGKSK